MNLMVHQFQQVLPNVLKGIQIKNLVGEMEEHNIISEHKFLNITDLPALPVITNVQSLAPITNGTVQSTSAARTTRSKAVNSATAITATTATATQIKHHIIIKPPPLPAVKNMMTMCKPVVSNKAVSVQSISADKECQTGII